MLCLCFFLDHSYSSECYDGHLGRIPEHRKSFFIRGKKCVGCGTQGIICDSYMKLRAMRPHFFENHGIFYMHSGICICPKIFVFLVVSTDKTKDTFLKIPFLIVDENVTTQNQMCELEELERERGMYAMSIHLPSQLF